MPQAHIADSKVDAWFIFVLPIFLYQNIKAWFKVATLKLFRVLGVLWYQLVTVLNSRNPNRDVSYSTSGHNCEMAG